MRLTDMPAQAAQGDGWSREASDPADEPLSSLVELAFHGSLSNGAHNRQHVLAWTRSRKPVKNNSDLDAAHPVHDLDKSLQPALTAGDLARTGKKLLLTLRSFQHLVYTGNVPPPDLGSVA